jgi:DNA-binding NarL/FixJ family response regulator
MEARTLLPDELTVGSTFARHRIEAVAGRGGMGIVFRATDLALDRPVALKLIAPSVALDPVFRARFEVECRAAAAIDHPHAVEVFHAGEEDGVLYVTMRYVEGEDLGALMTRDAPVDPVRAVRIIAQVAAALDAAHARGLVHRDVKPTNVLVAEREGVEHAFLTDFGLTKSHEGEAGLTKPGFAMGTADYMAPEQARGAKLDGRADVYALACVLFKTLTGAVPFDRGSDLEKLLAHLKDPPPSLKQARPDVPRALDAVVRRAMAKDPDDRPQTAGEFARDALAAVGATADGSPPRADPDAMSVVVADDSVLMRAGVVHLLQAAGFEVVGEASDADELLSVVREQRPDVAITDIRMPPTHTDEGLRAARTIRSELPGTGVLVLSQYADEAYAVDLLGDSAKGVGYLLKDRVADPDGFADSVRQVGQGGSALDPEVVAQMLNRRRSQNPLDALSPRQRQVLAHMAEGHSNHAIAESLDMTERAVERDIGAIFTKLDLPSGNEGHRRVLAVLTFLRS